MRQKLADIIKVDASFFKDTFDQVESQIVGLGLRSEEIDSILNNAFAGQDVVFIPSGSFGKSANGVMSLTTDGKTVKVFYDPYDIEFLAFDEKGWTKFTDQVMKLGEHELIHNVQGERGDREPMSKGVTFDEKGDVSFKTQQDFLTYLADPHEIMAWAHDAVYDLREAGLSDDEILWMVQHHSSLKPEEQNLSRSFYLYTFYFDPKNQKAVETTGINTNKVKDWRSVLQKYLKAMVKYLEEA